MTIRTHTYQIVLLLSVKLYHVFNVSLLELTTEDPLEEKIISQPPLIELEREEK